MYRVLIIQGPITSVGRSGKSDNNLENLEREDLISFDCKPNINKVYKDFGGLFDRVILSTWQGSDTTGLVEGIEILLNQDSNLDNGYIYEGAVRLIDNKYRQVHSILTALRNLDLQQDSLVVKIRTDQYINLEKIFSNLGNLSLKYIYVPYISNDGHIPDFYFVGTHSNILKLFDNYLKSNEIVKSFHDDLPLRYYISRAKLYNLHVWYLKSKVTKMTIRDVIASRLTRLKFRALNPDIYSSIIWRGESIVYSKRGLPGTALPYGMVPEKKKIRLSHIFFSIIFHKFEFRYEFVNYIIDTLQNTIIISVRLIFKLNEKKFNN